MGSDFILVGFTDQYTFQMLSFLFFSAVYIFTIVGNLGMIVLIRIDSRLQTPMYFFLSHLSLLDMCYSSTIVSKTLVNFLAGRKTISFAGCATQLFFFAACATTEGYLLAVMAYDRYVAVCKLLLYTVVMSQNVCERLLAGAYVIGVMSSAIHTLSIFRLPFCHFHKINHFFCSRPPLLTLACSDTHFNERLLFAVVGFNILIITAVILASYLSVLATVLSIHTTEGRCKVFSTCASHLATVTSAPQVLPTWPPTWKCPFHVFTSKLKLFPRSGQGGFCVILSYNPHAYPLIYSMRNNEVKDTLRRTRSRFHSSWCQWNQVVQSQQKQCK